MSRTASETWPAAGAPPQRVGRIMGLVILCLLPGAAVQVGLFGWGSAVQALLAVFAALVFEALALGLRRRPPGPALRDGSAVLTALLLALAVPPYAPWWITILGTGFAILVAKHCYGGLGGNLFNPAMAGYVFLALSFAPEMAQWPGPALLEQGRPGPWESVQIVIAGAPAVDALSGATPLAEIRDGLRRAMTVAEMAHVQGVFGGFGWEWVSLAFLAGGLGLLATGVIRWQIPAAMLGTLALLAAVHWLGDADAHASPLFHLFSGAAVLGAFFIATDPVSAPTSARGRLIFGAGVGALVYLFRAHGAQPDGVAFAVLLMNAAVPLIDRWTRPRVLGAGP